MKIDTTDMGINIEYFRTYQHSETGEEMSIIHCGWSYNFIELPSEWVAKLKKQVEMELLMVGMGLAEPSPLLQFAVIFFQKAY